MFIKTWGEIQERLDPPFYLNMAMLDKEIVQRAKYPLATFKQKLNMQRGRFGHRPRNDARYYGGKHPFIQTGNVVKASESNGKICHSQTLNELGLSTSRLVSDKVLLITIAANIGYTAILDYAACFPDSLVALTIKEGELSLEYLNVYIRIIRKYIENIAPQAAQKNINLRQLGNLPIIIPPKNIQKRIVDIMEQAYCEKRRKENEAKLLLDGLDEYLLQEIGIMIKRDNDNSFKCKMFFTETRSILGNRFDPEYHKPVFQQNLKRIVDVKYPTISLQKIMNGELIKGILPNDSQKSGECKVIQIGNINLDGTIEITDNITAKSIYSSKQRLEKGDVLIVITGATIGKVGFWNYDGEYYLGGDIVKFNTGNYFLNEIYAALLRTKPYQLQLKRCITGATNGHLALRDLECLPMPNIVDEGVLEIVATHISTTRAKAQLLDQEAQLSISMAKIQIQKILLENNV